MSEEITKTVELVSLRLNAGKAEALSYVYKTYGEILKEAVDIMQYKGITSWVKGIKELYRYFRQKYPDLPANYVQQAIRDAASRLKSFQKLKEKGLAYTEKPEVKQWTVSCGNKLWKLSFQGVEISTHAGWIRIPLLFHKQFYILYNSGWTLRSSCRWKIEDRKLRLYVFFRKTVEPNTNYSKVIGIDVNENNVTLFTLPDHKAITLVTNHSKIVLGYAYRRKAIQERHAHSLRSLRVALRKLRERNVKKALRDKVASLIAKIAKKENAILILEKLPKRFQEKVLKKSGLKSFDAHRLKQSAIRGIQNRIVEKALEYGVKVEFVDPKNTSRTCPRCGSSLNLMTGNAQRRGWKPRVLKCSKCGFTHDRDVIAAWNIAKKLDVSLMPWGSKGAHDPYVEWQVVTVNRKVEAQHPSLDGWQGKATFDYVKKVLAIEQS
ncbi:MAG: transposase [Saccharolobus sp.]|uniref:RNA-guided endonuclease InsQ/TnpB family protein n=1 Tax=Saccharolobus sp. TaxID=2100761 RepID=UPI00316511A0